MLILRKDFIDFKVAANGRHFMQALGNIIHQEHGLQLLHALLERKIRSARHSC